MNPKPSGDGWHPEDESYVSLSTSPVCPVSRRQRVISRIRPAGACRADARSISHSGDKILKNILQLPSLPNFVYNSEVSDSPTTIAQTPAEDPMCFMNDTSQLRLVSCSGSPGV